MYAEITYNSALPHMRRAYNVVVYSRRGEARGQRSFMRDLSTAQAWAASFGVPPRAVRLEDLNAD